MKIAVVGATGMIGSRVVAEAAGRGHDVVALSRKGQAVEGAAESRALDLNDTAALATTIADADATVIAVSGARSGGTDDEVFAAHRDLIAAAPEGRVLVVGGAGSLEVDGVRLKDTPGFPDFILAEATTFSNVLDQYRASEGLDWTVLCPAPMIAPGERTGAYRVGGDSVIGDSISAENFAVALVDELETSAHRGARFTVAS